ncbi:MAG: NifB/NifX family molybdenum-iron cluster-binding protein [Candidatus Thorarchaeota archaeon]
MTRVCITSTGNDLDALVDRRFGRCAYFIIVDTETMEFESLSNAAASASGGAGIQAAQIMASKDIEVVITGSVGPNAYPALESSGIRMMSSSSPTVAATIDAFKQGTLTLISTPGPAHAGIGRGGGRGRGQGGGRRGG